VPHFRQSGKKVVVDCEVNHFEEPGAVILHAGIREGAVGQPAVLPR